MENTNMPFSFMEIFQTCSKRGVWNYARADYVRLNTLIENTKWDFLEYIDVITKAVKLSLTLSQI